MTKPREEALTSVAKQMSRAIENFTPAVAKATEQYRKIFETAAGSLAGWAANADGWEYKPWPVEKLTRDEAFEGLIKRRKKGKR